MKTLEFTTIDKSEWQRGEWDNEPDKRQWIDKATGLPCLINRNHHGALCGYVGVSRNHPFYEKFYDSDGVIVDVHGGLTFSNKCQPNATPERGVCHTVEPGEDDDVWWFGFDCAHAFDMCPAQTRHPWHEQYCISDEVYRNFAYVTDEIEGLAKQLFEAA